MPGADGRRVPDMVCGEWHEIAAKPKAHGFREPDGREAAGKSGSGLASPGASRAARGGCQNAGNVHHDGNALGKAVACRQTGDKVTLANSSQRNWRTSQVSLPSSGPAQPRPAMPFWVS